MAYSDQLAARVRDQLAGAEGLTERKVFDGHGFFVDGLLTVAILGETICVHLDDPALEPFTFADRPVPGWGSISAVDLDDDGLVYWVQRAIE